jgi:hypothetical protein
VVINVISDCGDEFFDIAKDAVAQTVLNQIAKEAFHHVPPGCTGGREMQVKTRMTLDPTLHAIVLGGWGVLDNVVPFRL